MSADPYNLERFVSAQDRCMGAVVSELRAGRKRTHWMWFVFPQLKGLGQSAMSEFYGLSSLDEARAYLAHDVLGPRLVTCTELVLGAQPLPLESIFGYPDHLKFQSSMTLFAEAAPERALFSEALVVLCAGVLDGETLRRLIKT